MGRHRAWMASLVRCSSLVEKPLSVGFHPSSPTFGWRKLSSVTGRSSFLCQKFNLLGGGGFSPKFTQMQFKSFHRSWHLDMSPCILLTPKLLHCIISRCYRIMQFFHYRNTVTYLVLIAGIYQEKQSDISR